MTDLVDRYVTAAVAGVPQPQRDDVTRELQASVADAIDDLVASGLTREEAERQAMTELGDPAVLAERFGGRPRHLIGPAYFGQYVQLLRVLLMVVVPIVGVASLLAQGLAGSSPLPAVLSALGTMAAVAVQIAFWVTVVFVILERTDTALPTGKWTPDDLPEVVDRKIGIGEIVGGISWAVLLIWLMVWQRDHWLVSVDNQQVPILNENAWVPWLLLLIGALVAAIVLEVCKLRVGHWTVMLATANTVINATIAGVVVFLWSAGDLLTAGVADLVPGGLLNPLPWIVVLIAVLDSANGWWHVVRR